LSKTIDRLLKRRCHKVTIGDEDYYLKALTIADGNQIAKFANQDDGTYWTLGRALVESDGAEVFPRQTGESPEEYANRLGEAFAELPQDTLAELMTAVIKLARPPSMDTLTKN
jgi:hypothetical protein